MRGEAYKVAFGASAQGQGPAFGQRDHPVAEQCRAVPLQFGAVGQQVHRGLLLAAQVVAVAVKIHPGDPLTVAQRALQGELLGQGIEVVVAADMQRVGRPEISVLQDPVIKVAVAGYRAKL